MDESSGQKLEHRTMAEEVANELRRQVLSGELAYGQKLAQDKVATTLGVSTMPVREALLRLAAEGLVVAERNRSFVVARNTPADVRDAYWIYGQLIAELAGRACRKAGPAALPELVALREPFVAFAGDAAKRFDANWQFHSIVNAAAGSPRLLLILRSILRTLPDLVELPGSAELASTWEILRENAAAEGLTTSARTDPPPNPQSARPRRRDAVAGRSRPT